MKLTLPDRYEPKALTPLWQMDLRHKLDLKLGQNDPVSTLLWAAVYAARSPDEFEDIVAGHISALIKAVEKVRGA